MPSPNETRPRGWRPMTATDLAAVECVADLVHPNYPEDAAILAEKRALYPVGSFVLEQGRAVQGYIVAHPWRLGQPPKLNTPLGCIPPDADSFYIHDLALRPELRGSGAGGAIVQHLAKLAAFPTMSLVAVSGSVRFWTRHGFALAPPLTPLSSYGPEARYMVRPLRR